MKVILLAGVIVGAVLQVAQGDTCTQFADVSEIPRGIPCLRFILPTPDLFFLFLVMFLNFFRDISSIIDRAIVSGWR